MLFSTSGTLGLYFFLKKKCLSEVSFYFINLRQGETETREGTEFFTTELQGAQLWAARHEW